MDLNDFDTFFAMPMDEPQQIGGIKVATNKYETIPNSLFVLIWDSYRMIEKEYDILSHKLLSRQVTVQHGDTFGEKLEDDHRFHKYAYIETSLEDNIDNYKEFYDGDLVTEEVRKLILDQYGKVIREEWQTIRYVNGIASKPTFSTIEH